MFKILEIDGGGIKGIIDAIICQKIEEITQKKICEIFQLISGTSSGAILGGCLSAGISAKDLVNFYLHDGPILFKKRPPWPWNWLRAQYDRQPFLDTLNKILDPQKLGISKEYVTLAECKCEFIATAFGLSSGRTHFVKSTDDEDKTRSLVDVISWSSLSAAKYFGRIDVPNYAWIDRNPSEKQTPRLGESFQDGGQGTHNCTVGLCLMELLARGITDAGILSLGTGDQNYYIPFTKTKRTGYISQIIDFLYVGQAKKESVSDQIGAAHFIELNQPGIKICRLNESISPKMNFLDNTKDINRFKDIGIHLAKNIPSWI